MKREILCPDCAQQSRKLHSLQPMNSDATHLADSPCPNESVILKFGRAAGLYNCDHCNKIINGLDPCAAFTIHTGLYYEWEQEYIIFREEN